MIMSEFRKKFIDVLDGTIVNTGITSSNLITEDGLVIASNTKQDELDVEMNINFAAISASILSMAERGIEIINENKILEQITIDAGLDKKLDEDFTILITKIYNNVLLQIIFPKSINIGLIHFEISKAVKEMKELIKQDTGRELFSSIGSLT